MTCPPPVGARKPETVHFELEAIERTGRLADNASYEYWTFNGKVPGPFLRVCVGDTVIISLKNAANSVMPHNIDLHAVPGPYGQSGAQEFSYDKLMDEHPEYFVLNGAVGALTKEHPLRAKTGETIRVYFGVGGPNFTSSFHIIGTIFDRVYAAGSFGSPPLTGVQTVTVAPGSAAVVDLSLPVPGPFLLVDHALTRMERGLAGALIVDGRPAPETYHAGDGGKPHR